MCTLVILINLGPNMKSEILYEHDFISLSSQ